MLYSININTLTGSISAKEKILAYNNSCDSGTRATQVEPELRNEGKLC